MNMSMSLAAGLSCALTLGASHAAAATNYQDWWWNAQQSGMGVNIGHQGDTIAATWFLYGDDGKASFLVLSGPLSGNTVSGTLHRYTGPPPGPTYNPASVVPSAVGTGSITFTGDTTAVLNYTYDTHSGSLNLGRFSFATPPMNGTYALVIRDTVSGCLDPADNGTFYGMMQGTVSGDASNLNLTVQGMQGMQGMQGPMTGMMSNGFGSCTFGANQAQAGSIFMGAGMWSCTGGTTGNWFIQGLEVTGEYLRAKFSSQATSGDTCHEEGILSGVMIN
jgi:hypothetical protein